MRGFLGATPVVSLEGSPFDGYGPAEWALEYIARYGGMDGEQHKAWLLDQVARVLNGSPVQVELARWSNGHQEYRFSTGKPSPEYLAWVEELEADRGYDEGSPP